MADIEYDVAYVARSPASMKQDDFAAAMDELCNSRAASGWRLVNAVGDYGANVTLGVWHYFEREARSASDQAFSETESSAALEPEASDEPSVPEPVSVD